MLCCRTAFPKECSAGCVHGRATWEGLPRQQRCSNHNPCKKGTGLANALALPPYADGQGPGQAGAVALRWRLLQRAVQVPPA